VTQDEPQFRRAFVNKRKLAVGGVFLLAVVFVTMLLLLTSGTTDESKYREYNREWWIAKKLFPPSKHLPNVLYEPYRSFQFAMFRRFDANEKSLLASGYLTNVSIILTNASLSLALSTNPEPTDPISFEFHKAAPDYDFLPFSLENDVGSNRITINLECRTKDVDLFRQALAGY
jgi:hypothetical protein